MKKLITSYIGNKLLKFIVLNCDIKFLYKIKIFNKIKNFNNRNLFLISFLRLNFFENSNLNYIIRYKFFIRNKIRLFKKRMVEPLIKAYSLFYSDLFSLKLKDIFFERFKYLFFKIPLRNRSLNNLNNLGVFFLKCHKWLHIIRRKISRFLLLSYFVNKDILLNFFIYNLILKLKIRLKNIIKIIKRFYRKFVYRNISDFMCFKSINYIFFSFKYKIVKKIINVKKNYFLKKWNNFYFLKNSFLKYFIYLFIYWLNLFLEYKEVFIKYLKCIYGIKFMQVFRLFYYRKYYRRKIMHNFFLPYIKIYKFLMFYKKLEYLI
jgi:hypothetical protein